MEENKKLANEVFDELDKTQITLDSLRETLQELDYKGETPTRIILSPDGFEDLLEYTKMMPNTTFTNNLDIPNPCIFGIPVICSSQHYRKNVTIVTQNRGSVLK